MEVTSTEPVSEECNAKGYMKANRGKLMIVQRKEGEPTRAADFFYLDSVETHPTGLVVTGRFPDDHRYHLMASRVRLATQLEIAGHATSLGTS